MFDRDVAGSGGNRNGDCAFHGAVAGSEGREARGAYDHQSQVGVIGGA
jgi:hypothetical protein